MQLSGVHILVHDINAHINDNRHKFGTINGCIWANFGKKKSIIKAVAIQSMTWSNSNVLELILSRKYVTAHKPTVNGFCYFTL